MGDGEQISVLHVLGKMGSHQGGSSAATLAIAAATRDGGDRATLLTTTDAGESVPDADAIAVHAFARRGPACFSPALATWLWRHARRFDLIEVHEVFAFPALVVWIVATLRRVPFVVHPHGSLDPYDMRKHALAKTLLRPGLRAMLRSSAGVWLTADREEADLAHLGSDYRTVVSPLPVAPPPHPGDRRAFRERHGLDDDHTVVLFLGRLDPKKGLLRTLDAFETVADSVPGVRLVIAGSGEESFEAGIRSRVAASRHAPAIEMVGFLSGREKLDALAGADLFVLHSDRENFGIAPVEALHCGTPVLLSDEVYIAADLAAAGAAEVVPATDTTALTERMTALTTDGRALGRLRTGTAAAVAAYAPDRVARRDATVRRELLSSPGRRRVTTPGRGLPA